MAASTTEHRLIAQRYVVALFSLAKERDALDVTAAELGQLAQLTEQNAEWSRLVQDPTVSRAKKAEIATALLKKMKASDLMARFVERVALNGRLAALPAMYRLFTEKLAEERGELHVQVTAAKPLTDAQLRDLTAALAASTGKSVIPQVSIDPSLLAGVIVRAGSKMLDYSLSGRLRQVATALQPQLMKRS